MPNSTITPFGYFLNVFSLLHFGYLDDAANAVDAFIDNKDDLQGGLKPETVGPALDTARALKNWITTTKDLKNGNA